MTRAGPKPVRGPRGKTNTNVTGAHSQCSKYTREHRVSIIQKKYCGIGFITSTFRYLTKLRKQGVVPPRTTRSYQSKFNAPWHSLGPPVESMPGKCNPHHDILFIFLVYSSISFTWAVNSMPTVWKAACAPNQVKSNLISHMRRIQ